MVFIHCDLFKLIFFDEIFVCDFLFTLYAAKKTKKGNLTMYSRTN
jgi:hypothetical protein